MKRLLLLSIMSCFACCLPATAANPGRNVRALEVEIGAGALFGGEKLDFDKNRMGVSLLAEARYNMASLPLDVGVQVSGSMFHREVQSTRSLKFKSLNVLAVADVNIFRARAISIFAGAGFGYALCGETAPVTFDNSQGEWGGFSTGGEKSGICFVPRVGVELFHRMRVTFDYRLQEKANRHFDVTLGFVIGGGRK